MGAQVSTLRIRIRAAYFSFVWRVFDVALRRHNRSLLNAAYLFGANRLPIDDSDRTNPLIRSSLHGDQLSVEILAERYPHQLNEVAQGGQASLHAAATNGNSTCVSLLCDYGADVNLQTDRKHTPLMIACSLGHFDIVKNLLKRGADPKLCDIELKTCQHYAVKSLNLTKLLIQETNGELLYARDINGKNPFIVAVMLQSGNEIIQTMIEANNVYPQKKNKKNNVLNSQSNDGMTALAHACHKGMVDTVAQLLEAGARWDLRDAYGQTALHLAAKARQDEVMKLLLNKNNKNKIIDEKDSSLIWNMKDDDGLEAIHAIITGLITASNEMEGNHACQCMEVLLSIYPEAVHQVDFSDTSALHLIVQSFFRKYNFEIKQTWYVNCIIEMITLLLHSGANVMLEDESGWTCLHYMYDLLTCNETLHHHQKEEDQIIKLKKIEEENDESEDVFICKQQNKVILLLESSIDEKTLNSIDVHKLKKDKLKYLSNRGAYHRIPIEQRNDVLRGDQTLQGIATRLLRNDILTSSTLSIQEEEEKDSHYQHKIVILCGAGISTSAGIPDYRSNTGIYRTKSGRDAFSSFHEDPNYFWSFARKTFGPIMKGDIQPTPCHKFFSHLHKLGLLQRIYTQNIDGLECRGGVPKEKIVQCHGSIDKVICSHCSAPPIFNPISLYCPDQLNQNKDKNDEQEDLISNTSFPICSECSAPLRPSVTFFGEPLSPSFFTTQEIDFNECTLLIVLGTTLQVFPFAGLLNKVSLLTPRLLINKELTGPFRQLDDANHKYRDVAYVGHCDEGVKELAVLLGWKESDWL